jgi:hypothetical protein
MMPHIKSDGLKWSRTLPEACGKRKWRGWSVSQFSVVRFQFLFAPAGLRAKSLALAALIHLDSLIFLRARFEHAGSIGHWGCAARHFCILIHGHCFIWRAAVPPAL